MNRAGLAAKTERKQRETEEKKNKKQNKREPTVFHLDLQSVEFGARRRQLHGDVVTKVC